MATPQDDKTVETRVEDKEDIPEVATHLEMSSGHEGSLDEDEFKWSLNVLANIFSLTFIILCTSWSSLVPSTAIPFIAARFPTEAHNANWLVIAATIVSAVVASLVGDLSDILGRRSFLFVGIASGILGFIVSGLSTSLAMAICGQAFTGLATGCGFLAIPLIQEIVPKKQRPITIAVATLLSASTTLTAPIVEGVLVDKEYGGRLNGWRVGFYIGAALWALAGALIATFYHPMKRPAVEGLTTMQKLRKIDWTGAFLAVTAVTLFLLGINYGGNPYPWTTATVLAPIITGLVFLGLFAMWQWKGTSEGILPHAIFQDRNFSISLLIRIVGGFATLGGQAFLPQVAVNVYGTDGIQTAVWQLPANTGLILGAFVGAGLLGYFKEARWSIFSAMCSIALGGGLCVLMKPHTSFALWFFSSGIVGLASGVEAAIVSLTLGLVVPNRYIATAVCIGNAAVFLGGSIAATMYGQIYRSKISGTLIPSMSEAALSAGLPSSSLSALLTGITTGNQEALASIPGLTPAIMAAVQEAAKYAQAHAFSYIWYTLIAWCFLSAGIALFINPISHHLTDEVSAPVQSRKGQQSSTKDA